jgi:hypothetical protein
MIGLAVYLNGKKLTVAGAEDLGVLNAIVNAVGTLGRTTAAYRKKRQVHLNLTVGGLTRRLNGLEDEHLRWINLRPLRVRDRVPVRIVRTTRADKHQSAHSAGGNLQNISKKKRRIP